LKLSLKPMLHLRMVRTKARDSYSAKLCPLTGFRTCSLAFRRRIRYVRKSCTIVKPFWVKNGTDDPETPLPVYPN
jgi:hypothetical protein